MRWSYPVRGDNRKVMRFAFFPIRFDGKAYWLERVELTQVFRVYFITGTRRWETLSVRSLAKEFTRYNPGDTFETHECIICKRDPDASYCIPKPKAAK